MQTVYELARLPETLIAQYPVAMMAAWIMLALAGFAYIGQNMQLKKRRDLVDEALSEITDREKTSPGLFLKYLFNFGIIDQQERLVLADKYGPGIASDKSLAKLVARLMLEHCYSSERLARDLVDHFMTGNNGVKFITREAYLLIFLRQVLSCFSMEVNEEITDRSLLDNAVRRQLAVHKRQEKLRLEYLEQLKANKAKGKRFRAVDTAFGLTKPWWQAWGEKLKTLPIKALF